MPTLNERAHELANAMAADADTLGITVSALDCGTRIIDCGVNTPGSIEAGRRLAEVCLAGLAEVSVEIGSARLDPKRLEVENDEPLNDWSLFAEEFTVVNVATANPIAACMASQYAGWELKGEKFFAMGSGPIRAAACREELFKDIGNCERPPHCVGVLETSRMPPQDVCLEIAEKCGVAPNCITLCIARTASQAGTLQITARSVETSLHKLHVLGFDLRRIASGHGSAPLPPVASDDLTAIGWTNDAILYGAFVHLDVRGDDASLEVLGPQVPSNSSRDYGRPFAEIFASYSNDFYRIDPQLFSPAVVRLRNIDTGNSFLFGKTSHNVLAKSFVKK
ncbi:MAG TPA: methenyltetrahydromethanopterin cyclohydrolase [Lacipirellulaceae bacterium]|nr:methenyltetrahydromethanopterin cyclohydrolase [Lacipirellulaceae bacterium]